MYVFIEEIVHIKIPFNGSPVILLKTTVHQMLKVGKYSFDFF